MLGSMTPERSFRVPKIKSRVVAECHAAEARSFPARQNMLPYSRVPKFKKKSKHSTPRTVRQRRLQLQQLRPVAWDAKEPLLPQRSTRCGPPL